MPVTKKTSNENLELSKQYQKKSDKQHVLDNPDTYIGSIENVEQSSYIFNSTIESTTNNKNDNEEKNLIIEKQIKYIPGLYKLFDEAIVNCRDHQVRMEQKIINASLNEKKNLLQVSSIEVEISDDNIITLKNDGNGIDVAMHPEYNIWIPELIFANLRTSTNYDKTEKKIVGGKNGFGFKLVLIWSTWGRIETVDHIRKKKYVQEYKDNLNVIDPPEITSCKSKPYTKISFKPDLERMGLKTLDDDFKNLLKRRVYDIAAITDKSVKVKYNNEQLCIKNLNFENYVNLYVGTKSDTPRIYEEANERWEYAVCLAPNEEFTQVSFVNGIYTSKGGKHVDYLLNQIIKKLTSYIKEKKKVDVKPATIKEQLMLFINCTIENPAFDSQTKDYMNTATSNFGSSCNVSDKFIEKLAKMGVMNAACSLTEVKENKAAKKTDGSKVKSIRNIPKLIDANHAGTAKSKDCTIILCEGDSAKAGIVSGLSKEDRNVIGVYPLKGKLFNTRGETISRVSDNKEIAELKQILGLENSKKYTLEDVENKLRYGKILFMTDQDLDGSHIKGLGINLFDSMWNSLINIAGFIGFMNTPILKARKSNKELMFYNEGEYKKWKTQENTNGWTTKYYKGLGTSTAKEFKEYFKQKKIVEFVNEGKQCNDSIDKVFNKKRANDRKTWLENYNREDYLDTALAQVSYTDFINKEFIHFSKYDCERSIPNIIDGNKTSIRKILYSAFKRNLTKEIKVAQFSGYVSEHAGYHHGEASLNGAIVGMAQNYVGSNNINVLEPLGQFGTRLQNGKDAASERYIFTQLSELTRYIYRKEDDPILKYLEDDGQLVEPVFYVPIIPMILVNGSKGIGTGFSTDILSYDPLAIINKLQNKIKDPLNDNSILDPYYNGFNGTIEKQEGGKYLVRGIYELLNNNIVKVTELPVGFAIEDFKTHLEKLIAEKNYVKDYDDNSTESVVEFTITFNKPVKIDLIDKKSSSNETINELEKLLKLTTSLSTTNMHAFTHEEKLKKYNNTQEIIDDYYNVRMDYYKIRKAYMLDLLEKELNVLTNKARFVTFNLEDKIDLRKKSKDECKKQLEDLKFDKQENDDDYKYLLKMPMDSVNKENVERLLKERDNKQKELETLKSKSLHYIYSEELNELKQKYIEIREKRVNEKSKEVKDKKDTKDTKIKKKIKVVS
tara:strand:- start:173 stop:3709 length:3537 start_codon:yes stop_codon:yes gene_type:complete